MDCTGDGRLIGSTHSQEFLGGNNTRLQRSQQVNQMRRRKVPFDRLVEIGDVCRDLSGVHGDKRLLGWTE